MEGFLVKDWLLDRYHQLMRTSVVAVPNVGETLVRCMHRLCGGDEGPDRMVTKKLLCTSSLKISRRAISHDYPAPSTMEYIFGTTCHLSTTPPNTTSTPNSINKYGRQAYQIVSEAPAFPMFLRFTGSRCWVGTFTPPSFTIVSKQHRVQRADMIFQPSGIRRRPRFLQAGRVRLLGGVVRSVSVAFFVSSPDTASHTPQYSSLQDGRPIR
jgi:hypothetical protein